MENKPNEIQNLRRYVQDFAKRKISPKKLQRVSNFDGGGNWSSTLLPLPPPLSTISLPFFLLFV